MRRNRTSRRRGCETFGGLGAHGAGRDGALKKITETLQVGGPAVDRFRYYSNPIDLDESLAPVPVAKGRWARPDSCRPG